MLVCLGCHEKIALTGWPKQQEFIFSVLDTGHPGSRCQQSHFLMRVVFPHRWLMATFLLCAHVAIPESMLVERERD